MESLDWRYDLSASSLLQYAVFVIVVAVLVKPLGGYMARVFCDERTVLDPVLRPVERLLLVATALIVGGLSFFPALTLGPILEHLLGR